MLFYRNSEAILSYYFAFAHCSGTFQEKKRFFKEWSYNSFVQFYESGMDLNHDNLSVEYSIQSVSSLESHGLSICCSQLNFAKHAANFCGYLMETAVLKQRKYKIRQRLTIKHRSTFSGR